MTPIASDILAEIHRQLTQLEVEHDVSVLYACESGSRAWGFESTDSDYDVRFICVRPSDWYLAIELEARRDIIELPIDDYLDINGWDARKALQLFRKTNPPLIEWLFSPENSFNSRENTRFSSGFSILTPLKVTCKPSYSIALNRI